MEVSIPPQTELDAQIYLTNKFLSIPPNKQKVIFPFIIQSIKCKCKLFPGLSPFLDWLLSLITNEYKDSLNVNLETFIMTQLV